jgi:ATP-dependent Lhr-like helicase
VVFPDSEEFDGGGYTGDDIQDAGKTAVERYGRRYAELIKFIIGRVRAANSSAEPRSGDGSPPGPKGTVLVFTDSRRRVERISFLLNQAAAKESDFAGRPLSYAHHGSLSKEVRRSVEKALAAGEISCVVATGSLELGIDIGGVEEVILAGSPGSAAAALQRIGRSGHGVGMVSRGWLIPFHGLDLLQAAAVSGAIEERELERIECVENPLDILAQIVLALCAEKDRNEDELYETIRGFYVYRNLSRAGYDGVVRMLAGAYEGSRLRELSRRIFRDDETGTLSAAPGALPLLYTSGGVITSRGYYSLRIASNGPSEGAGTKIGELDEEFVWERRLGDCFDFGNRSWRITAIGNEAVEAVPLAAGADFVPFWHAGAVYRSPVLSRRVLEVLDGYYPKGWTSLKAEKMLDCFSGEAKKALEDFLHSQWSTQRIPLPGPSFIPIEIVDDPVGRGDAYLIVLHSFRGGGVNFPLSLALGRDIEARYDIRVEGSADDNAVFLRLPRSLAGDPASIIRESLDDLCGGEKGEERFRERLESSGVFGAAVREAAERALVLPRAPFGKRMPLWITRQKSKRLFDVVRRYGNFPATAEAWRTCLQDIFDMEGFSSFFDDIRTGALSLDFFTTHRNSPFSRELTWAETSELMYQYDERPDLMGPASQSPGPSVSDQVIAEALGNAAARPSLRADLTDDFCSRLRREIPGWAPEDAVTFCEWVKERIAIPTNGKECGDADEWERLLRCVPTELADALREDKSLGGKLEYVRRNGAETDVVVHRERAKKWKEAEGRKLAEEYLEQWLRFEGPISLSRIGAVFGLSPAEAEDAVHSLFEQGNLLLDVVAHDETGLVCDRENLELLLRLSRRKQRPIVKERPAAFLVPFLARRQGLLFDCEVNDAAETGKPWRHLAGIAAPAKLWETEFYPCRCPSYSGETLDREIRDGRLLWYGDGKEKAAFCRPEEMDIVMPPAASSASRDLFSGKLPAGFFDSPRSFWEIRDALAADAGIGGTVEALWKEVWRGNLSADSWEPVRRAAGSGFAFAETALGDYAVQDAGNYSMGRRAARIPRAIRERWRTGPPVSGNWFTLWLDESEVIESRDYSPLEEEELNRERVRLLLDRWGLLSRPMLEREAPVLLWSRLFPTMRRMELAGELVAGRFFSGVNSLQFASPRIAEELEEAETERCVYWMNAADPASPAGLAVQDILTNGLAPNESKINGPVVNESKIRRVPSTRLCFRGAELLAISNKGGKDLEIFISPDDPDVGEVMAFLKFPRTRRVQPENKIIIEKINGKTAAASVYFSTLSALGFVKDRGKMILW